MIIEGTYQRSADTYGPVRVDGRVLDPAPSLAVFNHSPTGFAWGYSGSGPAQLALAILLEAGVRQTEAVRLHQKFKEQFIADLPPRDAFRLDVDLAKWLAGNRR